jgi:hypothetical protein
MGYFRELPNLQYQSFVPGKTSSGDYVLAKNLFRRAKLVDEVYDFATVFTKYEIQEGERPDIVAEKLYGSSELDWVVLITAGITRIRDEWPLSSYQLYNYSENKYGKDLNAVRFYETTEVRDSSNRLILPAGKVVDKDFTIPNPKDPVLTLNPVVGISNYEYETRKNGEKSIIYVLRREYLQQFLNDMRDIMIYTPSSQYIDDNTIRTENTKVTLP